MTGLDKIIAQIAADADSQANQLLGQARAEADAILEEARRQADALASEGQAETQLACDSALELAKSSAQLARRRALLAAKQEIISSIIEKAQASIGRMKDCDYFALLVKIIASNALPETGELRLGKRDLERLPADFTAQLQAALAARPGASLTLSETPAAIDGGAVLIYGGVEENCSLGAIFYSLRDRMQDGVQALLF